MARKAVNWEPICSMRADRRTDMKLRTALSSFVKGPQITAFAHTAHSLDYSSILVAIMLSAWFLLLRIKGARYSHASPPCDIQLILSIECLGTVQPVNTRPPPPPVS
jgi:hypothetical protein